MTRSRFNVMASIILMLAIALPAAAQGKSGQPHGKPTAPPPTTTTLPTATTGSIATSTGSGGSTATAPFAWVDDASLMAPGTVWFGMSMVQWHGGGASQVVAPVFDGSIGLTPRVQLGLSVPRVAGGIGTTFFSAKVSVINSEARGFKLAVGPTLEILNKLSAQPGQSRTQFGVPVSVEINRVATKIYGSSGYFSPGVWYAGAGLGRPLTSRLGVSLSISHAWTSQTAALAAIAGPRRNDLSGGASFDLTPNIAVFGSLGRTIATAAENGAGTTVSFGLSLSAGPMAFTK
jgi:hypothetical protein